jgi:hypothetical protein
MKQVVIPFAVFIASIANAYAAKPCEELKSEIVTKLEAKGVKEYTLEVVSAEEVGDKNVVGSCDGGAKKIIYTRK